MRCLIQSHNRYPPIATTTSASTLSTPAKIMTPVLMIKDYVRHTWPNRVEIMRLRREDPVERANRAVADVDLPEAVYKTCPWQPRALVETGLRQWLRCCAAAMQDGQVVGMPSNAVDEAWHGFILCTVRYTAFCDRAYGRYLHHHPEGGAPESARAQVDSMDDQLRRTVIAWSLVAHPGEECVLWDLDRRVDVTEPWGISRSRVSEIHTAIAGFATGDSSG